MDFKFIAVIIFAFLAAVASYPAVNRNLSIVSASEPIQDSAIEMYTAQNQRGHRKKRQILRTGCSKGKIRKNRRCVDCKLLEAQNPNICKKRKYTINSSTRPDQYILSGKNSFRSSTLSTVSRTPVSNLNYSTSVVNQLPSNHASHSLNLLPYRLFCIEYIIVLYIFQN